MIVTLAQLKELHEMLLLKKMTLQAKLLKQGIDAMIEKGAKILDLPDVDASRLVLKYL